VPKSRDEALRYNDATERQLQFHTRTAPIAPPGTGERAAIYHGQGVGIDDVKDNIVEYFRLVDHGLHNLLRNGQAPLVLAGVEYLLPLYKEVTGYAHVIDTGITGNADGLRAEALHALAWPVVEPLFRKDRLDAMERYRRLAGTGRALNDLQEVVSAAYYGRVDTLFVVVGVQQWGLFHPDTQKVTLAQAPAPEHEDLLDLAALHTFLNSGTVYAVSQDNMPDNTPLAAVLRY
jgi:Bacterial archaeo-eukaryotic release factor family 3